ncbi:hypothetical protein ACFL0V_01920 [Nanoarchaeota archaeon]
MNLLLQMCRDRIDYDLPGILDRKVQLSYRVADQRPWTSFSCNEYPDLSFRAHQYELGDTEAVFWQRYTDKNHLATFEGYTNRFSRKIGHLRGYMKTENPYHRMGVWVRKGRLFQLRTDEDQAENSLFLIGMIAHMAEDANSQTPELQDEPTEDNPLSSS